MRETSDDLSFEDESGRKWVVFETWMNGERCLYFDSSDAFRRVREFPENWRELSGEKLLALSWSR